MTYRSGLDPVTVFMLVFVGIVWVLAILGFVLAFTVAPDAINMGLGSLISAVPLTIGTTMLVRR